MTAASPTLTVTDRALARLAAHGTISTPGVTRLHASPLQAARDVTVRRVGNRTARASRAGADVDRDDRGCVVTVRVTTRVSPPVLEIVGAVQERVAAELARVAGVQATVVVHVLDVQVLDGDPS